MKIALIGYGKMGHAIEQIALQRGHTVGMRITSANKEEMTKANLSQCDAAIEFTSPDVAAENVITCLNAGLPVVCGTTGWAESKQKAEATAINNNTAFLLASNFSVGVNIFFEVNKKLASLMNGHAEYNVTIQETHHTQKKDAPSGTAITLAEQAIENLENKKIWSLTNTGSEILPIQAHRVEGVPGTHIVTYSSAIDDIEIKHTAHNRDGFALGAVLAAEFIADKKGIFSMQDVLGII